MLAALRLLRFESRKYGRIKTLIFKALKVNFQRLSVQEKRIVVS